MELVFVAHLNADALRAQSDGSTPDPPLLCFEMRAWYRRPEIILIFAAAGAFFVYSTACVALYWSQPPLWGFINGLDPLVSDLSATLKTLSTFKDTLPSRDQADWVVLTRHLYAASLLFIAAPVIAHIVVIPWRLPLFIAWIAARRGKEASLASNFSFSSTIFGGALVILAGLHLMYIGGGEFDTRVERAWAGNPYMRHLVFLPLMVLSQAMLIPSLIYGVLSLFSVRLFNKLS